MAASFVLFFNSNNPEQQNNSVCLQHVGIPCHHGINVRRYFGQVIPGSWIGKSG